MEEKEEEEEIVMAVGRDGKGAEGGIDMSARK
jgi:hypothetical protein